METKPPNTMNMDDGLKIGSMATQKLVIPSCGHLMHQICNQLVDKRLLDSKEANRFMQRPSQNEFETIKRLLILFNRRGSKSFDGFLSVLRNVDGYPELSSQMRKVVDNYEAHSKAPALCPSSKSKPNGVSSNKRPIGDEQANKLRSAKRTRSFITLNSEEIVLLVGRDVSREKEQKALHRLSFLAKSRWNDQIFLNEDDESKEVLLQVNDHKVIDVVKSENHLAFQQLLNKSKYNLNDLENVISTSERSSLRTKLKSLGLFLVGVVGTVVYVGLKSNNTARSAIGHVSSNATMWDKNGLSEIADYDIEVIESRGNSSWWNYRFSWQ